MNYSSVQNSNLLEILSVWSNPKFYCLVKGQPFTIQSLVYMSLQKKAFEDKILLTSIFFFSPEFFFPLPNTEIAV